jgi:uncharacterized protein YdeI (YjbR/CyaY-like superfamily)
MTQDLVELEVGTRRAWRRWFERHHASSPGVWLVFHKQHTGVRSVPYEDAVREALCHGWIDSLVRRLDDDRYALKVTPRKPGSKPRAPRPPPGRAASIHARRAVRSVAGFSLHAKVALGRR